MQFILKFTQSYQFIDYYYIFMEPQIQHIQSDQQDQISLNSYNSINDSQTQPSIHALTSQMISQGIRQIPLITQSEKIGMKPILKTNQISLSYQYMSYERSENNCIDLPVISQISNIQESYQINHYPHSCIGVIIGDYQQNQQTHHIYGTGILIHNNMVFTNAQNLYSKRLDKQYKHIKFIPGLNENKHRGIYDVIRVYYPRQYTQLNNQKFNFGIIQLYDDLSMRYGYVSLNADYNIKDSKVQIQGYIRDIKQQKVKFYKYSTKCIFTQSFIHYPSFDIEDKLLPGAPIMVIDKNNNYSIVGIHCPSSKQYSNIYITSQIIKMIKKWTIRSKLDLHYKKLGSNICELEKYRLGNLQEVNLYHNQIAYKGCEYLKNTKWTYLRSIVLVSNNIDSEACKHLAQTNWSCLNNISLQNNSIDCQSFKYLKMANWNHLTKIGLRSNKIGNEGCQQLAKTNWPYLMNIDLANNQIGSEGVKYLARINWIYLNQFNLYNNVIDTQGCKYLRQSNWIHLKEINLSNNQIDWDGCKYLKNVKWDNIRYIFLWSNKFTYDSVEVLLLQQQWPQAKIYH